MGMVDYLDQKGTVSNGRTPSMAIGVEEGYCAGLMPGSALKMERCLDKTWLCLLACLLYLEASGSAFCTGKWESCSGQNL